MRRVVFLLFLMVTLASLAFSTQPVRRTAAQGPNNNPTEEPVGEDTGDEAVAQGGGGADGVKFADSELIASLKYDPQINGFNFENYTTEYKNLTPAEVRRLFGDDVCASIKNDNCILTPTARQWMSQINEAMAGGHCYGMAALSATFYMNQENPADFGNDHAFGLKIQGNDKLQREIAFWWATQATDEIQQLYYPGTDAVPTPNKVLDTLIKDFKSGKEAYVLVFYKIDETGQPSGGHAVTPWGVVDKGDGKYWVLIYDNNYPGVTRAFEFDRNTDSWSYEASINPNEQADTYEGNAETKTLAIIPLSAKANGFACPICDANGTSRNNHTGGLAALAQPAQKYNQLWMEGEGDLLITDAQGRRYGVENGKFYKEIPGVRVQNLLSGIDTWNNDERVYQIPVGIQFTVTLDGSRLKQPSQSEVVLIGPGYDLGVEEIKLDPGQKDTLTLSPDGTQVSYKTTSSESPVIVLGFDGKDADYGFGLQGVDLDGGGTITVKLDKPNGKLSINTVGSKSVATYGVAIGRYDAQGGEQVFSHDSVQLESGDTAYLSYGKWTGNKAAMTLEIDRGSKGTVAETLELTDEE